MKTAPDKAPVPRAAGRNGRAPARAAAAPAAPGRLSAEAGPALRRAVRAARQVARMHGTPLYIARGGKVVAIDP